MNKKIQAIALGVAVAALPCLTGCSDDFLKEKTDYSKQSPEIYNNITGARLRVQDIYLRMQPNANTGVTYRWPSAGQSDAQTQATEEFTGLSWYVDPDNSNTTYGGPGLFSESDKTQESPWGEIRNCNDVIEGITNGKLTNEQKNELLGQVYFFRAWQYYLLVKTYGGVPIVDHVQVTDVSKVGELEKENYRRTTKECVDWICAELEKAAEMLPARWGSGDFSRVTKGTALAVAGRVRLLYASPLFNRSDDLNRWQLAFEANEKALEALAEGGFGLAYEDNPGVNASGWSKMFSDYNSEEAVFVTLYNMLDDNNASHEVWRNNRNEQRLRPRNASGAGSGMGATEMMVDLFPMADGKRPGYSTYYYEVGDKSMNLAGELTFYKNRDPRFYRTFAFPGVRWRFDGDVTTMEDVPVEAKIYAGENYVLWNYVWYASEPEADDTPAWAADRLGRNGRGVYVRKRSNDFDLSPHTPTRMYRVVSSWTEASQEGLFGACATPHMEIRYAEVLLNYAEAAVGANKPDKALEALKRIRKRAGYEELAQQGICDGNYGLPQSGRPELFAAVLYERQVELAYEGKRFDDMRRWLLWDGGLSFGQMGAPAHWTLTGEWAMGTCGYLGVLPLNGKRRDNFELRAKTGGTGNDGYAPESNGTVVDGVPNAANDPIRASRPASLDLRLPFDYETTTDPFDPGIIITNQISALDNFYNLRLERRRTRGDSRLDKVITFKPQYYFLGLTGSAQNRNPNLQQTIGWADRRNGDAPGTFDPLAE